jgi:hypothetical protein
LPRESVEQRQDVIPKRVGVVAQSCGVRALNAPAGGAGMGAAPRDALERDEDSLEGVFGSRSRRGLA